MNEMALPLAVAVASYSFNPQSAINSLYQYSTKNRNPPDYARQRDGASLQEDAHATISYTRTLTITQVG